MAESTADRAENEAALAALEKKARKEQLTRAEINAVRRYEERRAGEAKAEAYAHCLGKDLLGLVGGDRKQLVRYQTYGAPRNEDGSYNLALFIPWLREHDRDRLKKEQETAVDALEESRRIGVERQRRQLAREKGELAPVEHFEGDLRAMFGGMRRALEAWPNLLAPHLAGLDPRQVQVGLRKEVRKFLASAAEGRLALAPKPRRKKKTKKKATPAKRKRR